MNASVVVPTRGEYEVHATSSDDDQSLDDRGGNRGDRPRRGQDGPESGPHAPRAAFHGREERQATEALSRPGAIRGVAADLVHHRHRWDLGGARFEETNELFDEMFASEQRRADYHGAMRRKYERAARYPWLPVEPDPPEPSP